LKYQIFRTSSFKKGFKKVSLKDQDKVLAAVEKLANGETLDEKYKDHALVGNLVGCRECHIKPDLLLVYRISDDILELALIEVGSHSELFG
jgi:mRNA interferase YafQ